MVRIVKIKNCRNFINDVKLLLSLVAERQSIVGCKRTDRVSSQVKEECWKAIEKTFNMKSNVFRSYKELRKKFDNIKSSCKRQTNKEKIFMHSSSGDLSQTTAHENDSVEEKGVFQEHDLKNYQKEVGGNLDFEKYKVQVSTVPSLDSESEDLSLLTEREDKPSSDYEYRHNYVSKLKKRKRRTELPGLPQSAPSCRKVAYVKATWLQEKAEVEINMLKQEHHIKMRHMEERHKLEMEKYKMELALLKINLDLKKRELDERERAKAKIESVISEAKIAQNGSDY
ncbi:uncharacterized protein LOC119632955 [Glossina fuscipes]|uniref:Regulatory protein zeste n=1 Tax=Glossina fuscipes TaxID=7396 RepID=A0A8U0WA32_9MUSC|nr:uncharacterized protein LOC119632955 [Glossina fuscipes]